MAQQTSIELFPKRSQSHAKQFRNIEAGGASTLTPANRLRDHLPAARQATASPGREPLIVTHNQLRFNLLNRIHRHTHDD